MPVVMLLSILLSLFAVTVCSDATTDSAHEDTVRRVAGTSSFAVTTESDVGVSRVTPAGDTPTYGEVASRSTASQTAKRTEGKRPSTPTDRTVPHGPTNRAHSEPPKGTAEPTSPGLSPTWGRDEFAATPGLVAVLCLFGIVAALVLVVVTLKCVLSPRSRFEELEDLPTDKGNEEFPFAQDSK